MEEQQRVWVRVVLELGTRVRDGLLMEHYHSDETLVNVLEHRANAGARY